MKKNEAVRKLSLYLKSHNIGCQKGFDDDGVMYFLMEFIAENAPGKSVESSIWFHRNVMEVRAYYNETGARFCQEGERIDELLQVLNFLNARVFLANCDGADNTFYRPSMLYTPRFYLTADGCHNICMTTIIPYDFYELAPLETEDYITIFSPYILDRLSVPIFLTAIGKWRPGTLCHG